MTQRCRLILDFTDLGALVRWVDDAREQGILPDGADAYKADGLDATNGGGPRTYVTADIGERPPALAAREQLTGDGLTAARDRAAAIAAQARLAEDAEGER